MKKMLYTIIMIILMLTALLSAQSEHRLTYLKSVSDKGISKGYTFTDNVVSHNGREMKSFSKQKAVNGVRGEGDFAGSLDVFVIGEGKEAVFEWKGKKIVNDVGNDIKVFENSFYMRGTDKARMSLDLGLVAVSKDGVDWKEFPVSYDDKQFKNSPSGKEGFVGLSPVYLHWEDNFIDPASDKAGGDAFDLSDAGVNEGDYIRYVKIIDAGKRYQDGQIGSNGVDIDGICAFHWINE